MSDVNVILATNRLQIAKDGDDILLDSVTYINITSVNPLVYEHKNLQGSVPGMPVPVTPATVITDDTNWAVELHMADGRIEVIKLLDVQNQSGWTNDADGYAQAEADIYAAFPAGGGGGGAGTVTSINVSGGTTGYSFTGGPVTNAGTITMTGSAAIPTGNTLWVDRVYGDDPTALPNRQDLPYDTVMGALAAASNGDLIHVRAGTSAEVIDDSDAPAIVHLYFEPGATAESISVANSGGWTVTGGALDEDITFSLNTGETLVLQTVTMRNLNSTAFNSIEAQGCRMTGNASASNGGSMSLRECFVYGNTTADEGNIASYNTTHGSNAVVQNGGVIQGFGGFIGGLVTDDPVTGYFFGPDLSGSEGNTAVLGADGRWGWSNALAEKPDTYSEGVKQTNVVNHQFQVSTTGGAVSVPLSALTPALATITNIQCTVLNASGAAVFACIDNNPGPSDNLTINTYAVATTIGSLLDPIIQPVGVNVWVEVTGTT